MIGLLRQIRADDPSIPLFHWGDLDAGGLRILAHLRHHLGTVTPLGMEPLTFDAYRAHTQPLMVADTSTLTHLRAVDLLADCVPLIDARLRHGRKLEQEAVSAGEIVDQLRRDGSGVPLA